MNIQAGLFTQFSTGRVLEALIWFKASARSEPEPVAVRCMLGVQQEQLSSGTHEEDASNGPCPFRNTMVHRRLVRVGPTSSRPNSITQYAARRLQSSAAAARIQFVLKCNTPCHLSSNRRHETGGIHNSTKLDNAIMPSLLAALSASHVDTPIRDRLR